MVFERILTIIENHLITTKTRIKKPILHSLLILSLLLFGQTLWAQERQDTVSTDSVSVSIDGSEEVSKVVRVDTVVANYDLHPQDSPEEKGFLLTTKDEKSSLRIRGSIRLNGVYDLNGLQTKANFDTYSIPTGEDNITEPRFFMSASQTRIGFDATIGTGEGPILTRIEADFLGTGRSFLRLRHAYGSYWKILAGQTWSVFSDLKAIPLTVDLEGPNSSVLERTIQVRYTESLKNNMTLRISAESPSVDFSTPDSVGIPFQSFPDIAARLTKDFEWGHLQAASVLRSISIKDTINNIDFLTGWGILLSGLYRLDETKSFLWQVVGGKGISRYITSLTGRGLDVVFNPENNTYETLGVFGGYVSFGIYWKENLFSYFTPGITQVFNKNYQLDDEFKFSGYFSSNVFWDVTSGVRVGGEYSFGTRIDKDGQQGNANRVSFIFYYDF
jgi:hypothetical protein